MTTQEELLTQLIKQNLADFISEACARREAQIGRSLAYIKEKVGGVVRPGDYPESWFYAAEWKGERQYRLSKAGHAAKTKLIRPMDKQLAEYREALVGNILRPLCKYEATDLQPIRASIGALGLEGFYNIGGERKIEFQAIMAGGHSIQCLHYRFTVKQY